MPVVLGWGGERVSGGGRALLVVVINLSITRDPILTRRGLCPQQPHHLVHGKRFYNIESKK